MAEANFSWLNEMEYLACICNNTRLEVLDLYFKKIDRNFDFLSLFPSSSSTNSANYYGKVVYYINQLDKNKKDKVFSDFKKIHLFASYTIYFGRLLEYLHLVCKKDLSILKKYMPSYEHMIIIIINFPNEFEDYYNFYLKEEIDKNLWSIRSDYYDRTEVLSKDFILKKLIGLQTQIQALFAKELRGKNCKVKLALNEDKIYIRFYLEDYPQLINSFRKDFIEQKKIYPIFKVKFVIDPNKKLIAIYTDFIDKQVALHIIFAKVIFNKNINGFSKDKEYFDPQVFLQKLLTDKQLILQVNTGSFIKDIYINRITLINIFDEYNEITINTKQNKKRKTRINEIDPIYNALKEQLGIHNSAKYAAKSIEFISEIYNKDNSYFYKKHFIINKQGQTNLGFEEIDEEIKEVLRSIKQTNFIGAIPINLQKFLSNLFAKLEHNGITNYSLEILISPQEIRSLEINELSMLISANLIGKYHNPKLAWCNKCDLYEEIIKHSPVTRQLKLPNLCHFILRIRLHFQKPVTVTINCYSILNLFFLHL